MEETCWFVNRIVRKGTKVEETLKLSVDESMVPTIDNNVLKLVVAVLSAFTLCIVVCQLVIFYSSRETIKKEKTIKVKNRNRIDII